MWQDHIPVLFERFEVLRKQRVPASDPLIETVFRKYEEFCHEMLEGIRTLLLNLIESQAYIRKTFPGMELRMYLDIHVGIMDTVAACGSDKIDSIPLFYYELRQAIEQINGYCILLRQDIGQAFRFYARLQRDRRFRQINLMVKQTIEAISRLRDKTAALTRLVGQGQAETALGGIQAIESRDLEDLIDSAGFSETEKALLMSIGN